MAERASGEYKFSSKPQHDVSVWKSILQLGDYDEQLRGLFWGRTTADSAIRSLHAMIIHRSTSSTLGRKIESICFNPAIVKHIGGLMANCGKASVVGSAFKMAFEMQRKKAGKRIFGADTMSLVFEDANELNGKMASKLFRYYVENNEKVFVSHMVALFVQRKGTRVQRRRWIKTCWDIAAVSDWPFILDLVESRWRDESPIAFELIEVLNVVASSMQQYILANDARKSVYVEKLDSLLKILIPFAKRFEELDEFEVLGQLLMVFPSIDLKSFRSLQDSQGEELVGLANRSLYSVRSFRKLLHVVHVILQMNAHFDFKTSNILKQLFDNLENAHVISDDIPTLEPHHMRLAAFFYGQDLAGEVMLDIEAAVNELMGVIKENRMDDRSKDTLLAYDAIILSQIYSKGYHNRTEQELADFTSFLFELFAELQESVGFLSYALFFSACKLSTALHLSDDQMKALIRFFGKQWIHASHNSELLSTRNVYSQLEEMCEEIVECVRHSASIVDDTLSLLPHVLEIHDKYHAEKLLLQNGPNTFAEVSAGYLIATKQKSDFLIFIKRMIAKLPKERQMAVYLEIMENVLRAWSRLRSRGETTTHIDAVVPMLVKKSPKLTNDNTPAGLKALLAQFHAYTKRR